MAKEGEKPHTAAESIAQWRSEIKSLKVKLRTAKPLQKIVYYDEIQALEAKISAALSGPASAQVSSKQKP